MRTAAQTALLFPGQGSQLPGMGSLLIQEGWGSELLQLAEASGLELARLLQDGTAEELRPTQVAQPALYYVGVGLGQLVRQRGLLPGAVAGHSLGEYCAAVVGGAIDPEDGMRLVLNRGRLMAAAPRGTMAAVMGMEEVDLAQLCLEVSSGAEVCVVANDNSPGQQVVSGTEAAVAELSERARALGAKRVLPLKVGGAFHSPLMAEASAEFAQQLDAVPVATPDCPVGLGWSGRLATDADQIRQGLRAQLESPVRWRALVKTMGEAQISEFVECGPGNVLLGLVRRILPQAEVVSCSRPEQARELAGLSGDPGLAEGAVTV